MRSNPSFEGTAQKLRFWVRNGLRPSPAPHVKRWAPSVQAYLAHSPMFG